MICFNCGTVFKPHPRAHKQAKAFIQCCSRECLRAIYKSPGAINKTLMSAALLHIHPAYTETEQQRIAKIKHGSQT